MRNNHLLISYSIFLLILLAIDTLAAFAISIPEDGIEIRNILCIDGIRWIVSSAPNCVFDSQLFYEAVSALLIVDSISKSGVGSHLTVFVRQKKDIHITFLERRAMIITQTFAVTYILLIIAALSMHHSPLLSIEGTTHMSPIDNGALLLLTFGIVVSCTLYTFLSHHTVNIDELARKFTHTWRHSSLLPLTLIFSVIVKNVLDYTLLLTHLPVPDICVAGFEWLLIHFPILLVIVKKH